MHWWKYAIKATLLLRGLKKQLTEPLTHDLSLSQFIDRVKQTYKISISRMLKVKWVDSLRQKLNPHCLGYPAIYCVNRLQLQKL